MPPPPFRKAAWHAELQHKVAQGLPVATMDPAVAMLNIAERTVTELRNKTDDVRPAADGITEDLRRLVARLAL